MASDVQTAKTFEHGENAFYIALRGTDADEIQAHWNRLAEGATILTPIAPLPSPRSTECSPTASMSPGSSSSPLRRQADRHPRLRHEPPTGGYPEV